MSDESTSGDTSAEVERQTDAEMLITWACETLPYDHLDIEDSLEWASYVGAIIGWHDRETAALRAERDALASRLIPGEPETAEDRAADVACMVRASQTEPYHLITVHAGDVVRWLREIAAARARLPSPAAVRAARVLAAECVDAQVEAQRVVADRLDALAALGIPNDGFWRVIATNAAADIRDLARTYRGTRDEGGDVDHLTLLDVALSVDGCTTLDELEEMVRELREVDRG